MNERSRLLESIADTIADYRAGEIARLTPEHVDRWIRQFESAVQKPLLSELDHVLSRTYLSRNYVENYLSRVFKSTGIAGEEPCVFWDNSVLLNIQKLGNSQREINRIFRQIKDEECDSEDLSISGDELEFFYLDDGVFSCNHVADDL
jgi:hypothetical protein